MTKTRRDLIVENHEAISRTIYVVGNTLEAFKLDEQTAASQEVQVQLSEVMVTLVSLLQYAGISSIDMLHLADAADRERAALEQLGKG